MRKFFLLTFLLIVNLASAQEYILKGEIQLPDGKFTTDPLGNIYIFNKGDVTKFSPEGMELNRFSTRDFGEISNVDASNPLKVLVVFQEFSKAVILDASLGQNSSFDISFPNIPFVKLICSSRENGFWIFDPIEKRLKRISEQLTILEEGTPIRQITEEAIVPSQIFDSGNWLVINTTDFGFLVFDRFGTYYKTVQPSFNGNVQVNGNEILFKEKDKMVLIDIKSGITRHFVLPENEVSDECRVEGSRIFLRKKNSLKIYSY